MLETGFKPVCTSCIALSVATNGNPLASSKPFPISMRTSLTQRACLAYTGNAQGCLVYQLKGQTWFDLRV
ncbi:MAG TPA: hypothetical protein VI727_03160 [Candidatus Brocadiaceae bacterium]|nr:hypothetical protein [Candidatus Brocadiaceae bacterium]